MRYLTPLLALLLLSLALVACRDEVRQERIAIHVGGVPAWVEIAADPASRGQGLMHRTDLEPDEGMLLVFPEEHFVRLWMLNTPLPLDAGFFDSKGRYSGHCTMQPDNGKEIHIAPRPASYALEMPAGWFERHAIEPGSLLELPFDIHAE